MPQAFLKPNCSIELSYGTVSAGDNPREISVPDKDAFMLKDPRYAHLFADGAPAPPKKVAKKKTSKKKATKKKAD